MAKAIKRIPVIGWLGVALLAFSFGLVLWVMRSNAGEDANGRAAQAAAPKKSEVSAACYGYVDVEPGVAKLYPLQPGRVVKIAAHDNDMVEKDAPLVILDDTVAKAGLEMAQVALKVAHEDLEKAKAGPKVEAEKITGQKAAIAAKKAELEAVETKLKQAKDAFEKRTGASKEDVDTAEAAVRGLKEAVKGEEAKLHALEAFDATIDVRRAEQQIK